MIPGVHQLSGFNRHQVPVECVQAGIVLVPEDLRCGVGLYRHHNLDAFVELHRHVPIEGGVGFHEASVCREGDQWDTSTCRSSVGSTLAFST